MSNVRRMMMAAKKSILPSGYTQLEYVVPAKSVITNIYAQNTIWEVDTMSETATTSTEIIISYSSAAACWFGAVGGNKYGVGGGYTFLASATDRTISSIFFESGKISVTCNGE